MYYFANLRQESNDSRVWCDFFVLNLDFFNLLRSGFKRN